MVGEVKEVAVVLIGSRRAKSPTFAAFALKQGPRGAECPANLAFAAMVAKAGGAPWGGGGVGGGGRGGWDKVTKGDEDDEALAGVAKR